MLLGQNKNRYERYKQLSEYFDIFFPNAVPLTDNMTIAKIRENKQKLIAEYEEKCMTTR